ncbi:MAG: hypothetical protein KC487_11580, partial [Anaerolineae bacterium]|nr:hypothetical protein [Anaerolineae bacterium]
MFNCSKGRDRTGVGHR